MSLSYEPINFTLSLPIADWTFFVVVIVPIPPLTAAILNTTSISNITATTINRNTLINSSIITTTTILVLIKHQHYDYYCVFPLHHSSPSSLLSFPRPDSEGHLFLSNRLTPACSIIGAVQHWDSTQRVQTPHKQRCSVDTSHRGFRHHSDIWCSSTQRARQIKTAQAQATSVSLFVFYPNVCHKSVTLECLLHVGRAPLHELLLCA